MTLGTITRTQVHCDATVQSACNTRHPNNPHTCPQVLEVHSVNPDTIHTAATTAGWTITPGKRLLMEPDRHYCPAHHDQAP
jgi:hypothetical protein